MFRCNERRNGLIGMIRIPLRIRMSLEKGIRRHDDRLMVQKPIEATAAERNCRLHHDDTTAGPQYPGGLFKKDHRELDMVKDVDHCDIRDGVFREGQRLSVGHAVEPWGELNIGSDEIGQAPLEHAYSAADLYRAPRHAGLDDPFVEI